jgi:MATE family multidrug resistance protein
VSLGVLRGYNDIRIPTILATVAYLGVAIPVGYVAAFQFSMGATGVWLGYLVGLSVASVGYLWRISVVTRRER